MASVDNGSHDPVPSPYRREETLALVHMKEDLRLLSDNKEPLEQIRAKIKKPICLELCEISKHQYRRARSQKWINTLECLYAKDSAEPRAKRRRGENGHAVQTSPHWLGRRPIHSVSHDYIAVSYPWIPSVGESTTKGGYAVQSTECDEETRPSEVRDVVLDRVLNFSRHAGCSNIWIDAECINQANREEQQAAIQVMDLVYNRSKKSVAILAALLESEAELSILVDLLDGKFVKKAERSQEVPEGSDSEESSSRASSFQPSNYLLRQAHKADLVLELLDRIVSDKWWTRAWTFQEDYKAGINMYLLIPHVPALERTKDEYSTVLGNIPGELCVKSVRFRDQANRFCLAYKERHGSTPECEKILYRAAKYTVRLPENRSMAPTIFRDIEERDITQPWDLIPIAANCCNYPTRLNVQTLNAGGFRRSLSLLTLFLLNGDILDNDNRKAHGSLSENVFEFLLRQSMDSFDAPRHEKARLFFNSGCRFINPTLTPDGIQTLGQLWKVGMVVQVEPLTDERGNVPVEFDKTFMTKQLMSFAKDLAGGVFGKSYQQLAADIRSFLKHGTGNSEYRNVMAEELVYAITRRRHLHVACRAGEAYSPYRAIFWDKDTGGYPTDDGEHWSHLGDICFFTAEKKAEPNSGDVDRRVTLEVEWQDVTDNSLPKLIIKKWAKGLSFSDDVDPCDVVFPWPPALAV